MPLIYYRSTDYKNNHAHVNSNGIESLRCRKLDLYRSMITVGNPSFISQQQIRTYGLARAIHSSILEKVGTVWENIESDRNGMRIHPIYHSHVSDKKRIVSYNLGMAFAKFYAEQLLDIPNLIHVESLKTLGAIDFADTDTGRGREPDLVGQCTNGDWHVFEAKGMSSNKLNPQLASAKEQVERVSSIHGVAPETLNACATYFSDQRILTYLQDPESRNEKVIKVLRDKFIDSTYKPLFLLGEAMNKRLELHREDGINFYAVDIEAKGVHLRVGIDEEVHDLVRQKEFSSLRNLSLEKLRHLSKEMSEESYSIGQDGVIVKYRNF
ncbi:TPA: hypothetical protein NJ523_004375 [Vibrio parahaemolyticus]|nr:hypothetical protein [Vibrio parahaemolyticus]HCG8279963.1 hypothetical protein [Vibrio parahaemolyticus]HCH0861905.1 hypothetical protein [Vibrio parahaemolyticus]